ncbi:MAG: hypothetical protein DYG92_14740 [Leptolyngbya sp. PLA1]|nr:hypothetical protein [Leptolyngbya sp. PLA1]
MPISARAGWTLPLMAACAALTPHTGSQDLDQPFTLRRSDRPFSWRDARDCPPDVFGPAIEDVFSEALDAPVSFASPVPETLALNPSPLPAGQNVLLMDYLRAPAPEDTAGLRTLAQNFDLLVLHEWHAPKIATFRQHNPDIVVLLYKTRGFAFTNTQEAVENYNNVKQHDFVFMHDAGGAHIAWDWNGDGRLEAASPRPEVAAYQSYYYDRALASVAAGGFDGLLIDDLWTYEGVYGTPDVVEYSNAGNFDALQAAMTSYLAAGLQRTRASGLYLAGNIGWWQQPTGAGGRAGRRYMEQLDFAMQEKFFISHTTRWNTGNAWFPEINNLIREMRETGNALICHSRGDTNDRQAMLYALGCYLSITDRDGRAVFSYLDERSSSRIPPIFAEYELAERLGRPLYDVRWHSTRLCGYRQFANGYVVVNPNSTARTVPELAGLYDLGGVRVPSAGYTFPAYSAMLFFYSPVQ